MSIKVLVNMESNLICFNMIVTCLFSLQLTKMLFAMSPDLKWRVNQMYMCIYHFEDVLHCIVDIKWFIFNKTKYFQILWHLPYIKLLNVAKKEKLRFSYLWYEQFIRVAECMSCILDGSDLEYVDNYENLGVWLDCKLSLQILSISNSKLNLPSLMLPNIPS
jgi:hypothetical protein